VAPLLEVRGLRVTFSGYRGESQVLAGVDLEVGAGEQVGLVGETGCGKSVAMKAILGLLPSPPVRVEGEVRFRGRALGPEELRALRGREITMIFQDPMASLNPVFTIGQQLHDVILRGGKVPPREAAARARAILREVRLPDPDRVLRAYPFQLSGGMRQRVLIAMALVNEPDLVIADEPGTALDVTIQAQILLLLRDLVERQGISVLLISHNLGVVRQVTRRVYVMYAGTIVEVAPTAALFRTPHHPYTQGLLAAVPKLTGEGVPAGIEGMIPDYVAPPPGCRFAPRCPYAMAVCDTPPPAIPVGPAHQAACWLYSPEAVLASGQAHGHDR
jgi:peptide/nickel transport system ATP-binding protein